VAAGKSNVFKALLLIQNSVHRSFIELFPPGLGEFHWVRSRWAEETAPVGFEIDVQGLESFPGEAGRYLIRLADSPGGIYVLEETLQRRKTDGPWQWVFQRRSKAHTMGEFGDVDPYEATILNRVWHSDARLKKNAPGVVFAREVARVVSRFGYYHLEAGDLKGLGTGQTSDRIGYNGGRLPDFIAWAKSEAQDVYASIFDQMKELLPELEDILVTQVSADRQGLAMSFRGHRGYIAAPDLSDGTMFTLGMLCITETPQRPAIVCIEEPEAGLHPRRLRWLFDRFLEIAYPQSAESRTQLIFSTHSPYLVDFFSEMPQSIQIVEQKDGRSRITPLQIVQKEKLHTEGASDEGVGHQWATGLFEGL